MVNSPEISNAQEEGINDDFGFNVDIDNVSRSVSLQVTHVMYDGYDGDTDKMADMARVYETAYALAKKLGIESLDRPYTIPYFDGKIPEDSGVSACWLFPGGHLTIHTFDKKKSVFVDVAMMNYRGDFAVDIVRVSMRAAFGVARDESFLRGSNPVEHPDVIPTAFGPHLTFNGRLNPSQRNLDWIYGFLEAIPLEIGMTPISTPTVLKPKGEDGQRQWDGLAIIAESHIAIHARPDGGFYFDIFSCKAFDTDAFLQLAREKGLDVDESTVTLAARGKDFPR